MGRYQRGHVYEAFGAFHVRYYQTELAAGQPKRVQRSQRLCAKDHKHHSVKCKPVQTLAAEVMQKVNAIAGSLTQTDTPIVEFWEQTYLPHLERTKKAGTLHGYKKIWEPIRAMTHDPTSNKIKSKEYPTAGFGNSKFFEKTTFHSLALGI